MIKKTTIIKFLRRLRPARLPIDELRRRPLYGRGRQARALKAKWADPVWRAKQLKAIAAGRAKAKAKKTRRQK